MLMHVPEIAVKEETKFICFFIHFSLIVFATNFAKELLLLNL